MITPELLTLNESTTGLDLVSKARLCDLILARADDDATIIMTTHGLAKAEHLASHVLVMNKGRVLTGGIAMAPCERLGRSARIIWVQGEAYHIHSTHRPGCFVKGLDLGAISVLTITRLTLKGVYLSLVSKEVHS